MKGFWLASNLSERRRRMTFPYWIVNGRFFNDEAEAFKDALRIVEEDDRPVTIFVSRSWRQCQRVPFRTVTESDVEAAMIEDIPPGFVGVDMDGVYRRKTAIQAG